MESPWLSNMFRQTIKQRVSMFLQGPQSTSAFWLIMNFDPFFLLYGETVVLFSFFCFGVFPGSARAWTMFAQLKHLQTSVHPMPPTTHRHFELQRLSFHDLWLAFGSPTPLLFCPTPHLQPLFRLFFYHHNFTGIACLFAIVTSTRVGTRVVHFVVRAFTRNTENIWNWLIFLIYYLFVTVILTWNFWNDETMSRINTMVFDKVSTS